MKLKNNKYFAGKYTDFKENGGWFVASFLEKNNPRHCDELEVLYMEHKAGDKAEAHYHNKKVELLIFLEGMAKYNVNGRDIILKKGDFLFVNIKNIISGVFLKPSKILAIHSPSISTDKVLIKE
jgi:mannose-6-phosphate isomerase-like protein (cupin superfamily)